MKIYYKVININKNYNNKISNNFNKIYKINNNKIYKISNNNYINKINKISNKYNKINKISNNNYINKISNNIDFKKYILIKYNVRSEII